MKTIDKLFLSILFGSIPPIALFLLSWWVSILFNFSIDYFRITVFSLVVGIATSVFFIPKSVYNYFTHSVYVLIFTYLFYSICIYGALMGMPLLNLSIGVLAGYYFGRKIRLVPVENYKKKAKSVSLFTSFILMLLCGVTTIIVYKKKTDILDELGLMLYDILRIKILFEPKDIAIIIISGSFLIIILQYYITYFVIRFTQLKIKNNK